MLIPSHWIRVPVRRRRRELAASRLRGAALIAQARQAGRSLPDDLPGYSEHGRQEVADWLEAGCEGDAPPPDLVIPEDSVWLLIEPPADLTSLPKEARQASLAIAISAGKALQGRADVSVDLLDSAEAAMAQMAIACVRAVAKTTEDGGEKVERVEVRPVHQAAPGVLPLAAIQREERQAIQEAVRDSLASFRDLL